MAKKKAIKYSEKPARIYIGQSIPGLSQYTVFAGELPPHVEALVKENDAVRGLIVPVDRLQEARREMRTKGHALYIYAAKLSKKEE